MRLILAVGLALAMLVFPAVAQDVAVAEPSLLQQIINAAGPAIWTGLGLVALFIVNSLADFAKNKFGLDIEKGHRDALHSALLTGIRLALVKFGWVPGTDVPPAAVAMAVNYARDSVPDAIEALKPDTATLTNIAESKTPIATAEVVASGPEAVKVAEPVTARKK